ncbi:MAG: RHS repeat protein, partial [Planctomycetes bacterium]|nr:RHS repeat protein [Planctomycetota bacterium]
MLPQLIKLRDSVELDVANRPLRERVEDLPVVTYGYDENGRVQHVQHGDDRAWRYVYDASGRLESVTDTLGRSTNFDYDDADRVTLQTLPDGEEIAFAYDANGNLTGLTPPDRPEHTFEHSGIDQTTRYAAPPPSVLGSESSTEFSYNDDHQLIHLLRPDNVEILLDYEEPEGRLATITIPRGEIAYSYKLAGTSGAGLVDSITSPDAVTLQFAYDGPLPLSESTSGALASTVSLTYDHHLRPVFQSVNGETPLGLRYDLDGRLAGAGIDSLRYNASGLIDSTDLAGFTASSGRTYNAYGELEQLRYHRAAGGTFTQNLTRDRLGRIIALTESIGGDSARTDSFTYTTAGRLHRVKRGSNILEEYAYDGNGNRTSASRWLGSGVDTATATFDQQDRMTRYRKAKYVYSANGELLRRTVPNGAGTDSTTCTYDPLGNLITVRLPMANPIVTYLIDGRNRRVARKVNGTFQRGWIYQDGLRVVGELDSTGALAIRYVYGSRSHVPDYMVRYGTTYRIISDHLGSVRMVVDASSGAVAESLTYDAWGRVRHQMSPGFLSLGFAGGLYDHHTGLVRFGARDYDPAVGRWT